MASWQLKWLPDCNVYRWQFRWHHLTWFDWIFRCLVVTSTNMSLATCSMSIMSFLRSSSKHVWQPGTGSSGLGSGLQKIQRQVELTPAVQLLTGVAGCNTEPRIKPVDHHWLWHIANCSTSAVLSMLATPHTASINGNSGDRICAYLCTVLVFRLLQCPSPFSESCMLPCVWVCKGHWDCLFRQQVHFLCFLRRRCMHYPILTLCILRAYVHKKTPRHPTSITGPRTPHRAQELAS